MMRSSKTLSIQSFVFGGGGGGRGERNWGLERLGQNLTSELRMKSFSHSNKQAQSRHQDDQTWGR